MTLAPAGPAGFGVARFERAFVVAFAVGGTAFHSFAALEFAQEAGGYATAWTIAAAALLLPLPPAMLIAGILASMRVVRRLLLAYLLVFVLLLLTLIPAMTAGQASAAWLIDVVPVALTACAVVLRGGAIPLAIASICLLMVLDRAIASADPLLAAEEGLDMAMVGALLGGLAQAVIRAGRSLESAARDGVLLAAREAERSGRRGERIRVGALVHDEILSVLLTLDRFARKPERARAGAESALAHLAELRRTDPNGPTESRAQLAPEEFVAAARERVAAVAAHAVVTATIAPGAWPVPAPVAQAFLDATVQAARNSSDHARRADGTPARIDVAVHIGPAGIAVQTEDDGGGFTLAHVPPDRMGLNTSILGRVRQLAGASAQIASEDGTRVRLAWRR